MKNNAPGSRVELHPATDEWMSGDRYGTVKRTDAHGRVWVRLDRSGRLRPFHPDNILRQIEPASLDT
jgi:hypothetical protein